VILRHLRQYFSLFTISEEIARQLENSQAKYVLTIGLFLENIRQACETYNGIEKIIVLGMEDKPDDVLGFIEMVLHEDGSLYDVDRDFDIHNDIVALPYSSGTTGPPKGIKYTRILSEIGRQVELVTNSRGTGAGVDWFLASGALTNSLSYF
jgi:long-subunit acyl-CoA synthetase (AMP-forming)